MTFTSDGIIDSREILKDHEELETYMEGFIRSRFEIENGDYVSSIPYIEANDTIWVYVESDLSGSENKIVKFDVKPQAFESFVKTHIVKYENFCDLVIRNRQSGDEVSRHS